MELRSLKQSLPLDGKDIWPVLVDGAKSPHDAILLSGSSPGKAAVRARDWKLLYGKKAGKGSKRKGVNNSREECELFNLDSDIGEKKSLAAANPDKLAEMKAILHRLLHPSGTSIQ